MSRCSKLLLSAPSLLALALLGCTQNVERSPVFQDLLAKVNNQQETIKTMNDQLTQLDANYQKLSKDINTLMTRAGGASPDAINALEGRLKALEEQTAKQAQAPRAAERAPRAEHAGAPAEPKVVPPPKPGAKPQVESATEAPVPKPGTASRARRHRAGAERTKAVTAEAKSSSSAGRGQYHRVEAGETLSSIATRYKVSVQSIQDANHLPASAPVPAGQNIYIPAP